MHKYIFFFLSLSVYFWCKTLRYVRVNYEPVSLFRIKGPVIFSIWHNELMAPMYLHRNENVTAVVSSSKDGEILSQVLSRLGYSLARGSSTRQGTRAVRSAFKQMRENGKDVVFTVDGPKGPRHEVKPGIIYLANKSKAPIVPVRVKISKAKIFKQAWDKFILPWPGAKCKIIYQTPYYVSEQKADSNLLQKEALKLKEKMDKT